MHVFYTPDIESSEYSLNEEESKHCTKVLRLQKGAVIHLIDGRGGLYKAELIDDHKKRVTVKVIAAVQEYHKRNHYLHIAIAPTKNMDRLEWFLEKATEIGIDEITMVICARSERRTTKEERLNKVVTSGFFHFFGMAICLFTASVATNIIPLLFALLFSRDSAIIVFNSMCKSLSFAPLNFKSPVYENCSHWLSPFFRIHH